MLGFGLGYGSWHLAVKVVVEDHVPRRISGFLASLQTRLAEVSVDRVFVQAPVFAMHWNSDKNTNGADE